MFNIPDGYTTLTEQTIRGLLQGDLLIIAVVVPIAVTLAWWFANHT